jgi:hypothetical protein
VLFAKPKTVTDAEVLLALPMVVIAGFNFTSIAPGAKVGYSGSPVTKLGEVP